MASELGTLGRCPRGWHRDRRGPPHRPQGSRHLGQGLLPRGIAEKDVYFERLKVGSHCFGSVLQGELLPM